MKKRLPYLPTILFSSWKELQKRKVWHKYIKAAENVRGSHPRYTWAIDPRESCGGCRHLDEKTWWCNFAESPACINPVTTVKHGWPGMACCGGAFEIEGEQLILPLFKDGLGF